MMGYERWCPCGDQVPPGRSSRWCSSWCQAREEQGLAPQRPPGLAAPTISPPPPRPAVVVPLESAGSVQSVRSAEARVLEQLESVGLVESWEGAVALGLARDLDHGGQSGSAKAALARELRATMGQLLRGVDEAGSRVGSMRNELAERRARRVGGE